MPTPRTPRGTPRGTPKIDVYSPAAWAGPKVTQLYEAAYLSHHPKNCSTPRCAARDGAQLVQHRLHRPPRPAPSTPPEALGAVRALLREGDSSAAPIARRNVLTALAVLALEAAPARALAEAGAVAHVLRALHAAMPPNDSSAEEERLLAAYAVAALSADAAPARRPSRPTPTRGARGLLRLQLASEPVAGALCYQLTTTLANLALHTHAAQQMVADGAVALLAGATAARVVILHPPSLLSALGVRTPQRTRGNLGGVAARALVNLASAAPDCRLSAREAGALESLWKLGWGTTDAGVQAVVREALEVLTEQSFDFGAGFTEKAKEAVMAAAVTARGGRK